ncbi:hypothetical protein F0562_016519 [Nyssa sinensis]|uniref:RING-type E3 ubiquitin transferase n=1 Tax=Nyssa sinensis TaxID=561372 RepID=A0A5J4ZNB6_9ASTE|nr:hypothetical protein F0562_016519 [Nyssa sinensis]
MAGILPDYIQNLDEEEIYDQVQQLIEDHDGVVEDEDEDESDSEDTEEDEGDEDEDFLPEIALPTVSVTGPSTSSQEAVTSRGLENVVEENEDSKRTADGGEMSSSNNKVESGENSSAEELNRSQIDGLFCPICMEAWTNAGDHQICCLPCGHLYGLSCIKRWLQQHRSSAKCPQCNRKCSLKDVRVIYASQIVVVDQESQKKVKTLEAKCASLEKKDAVWCKKAIEWQKREANLHQQIDQLMERTSYLEHLLGDMQNRPTGILIGNGACQEHAILGHNLDSEFGRHGFSGGFVLQKDLLVDGARVFDVDASSQILIIARRLAGMGGMHVLTKMSLIAPHETENIQLPVSTKAVKDLRVSPHGRLTLLAFLGKKLSVLSTESNNIILSYDLPAAAWSCSWDLNSSHYLYAGLQNGMLLVFDMRQTTRPVESLIGLTGNLIHTIHSLSPDLTVRSGVRTLLTASSVGLCEWNFGGIEERPFLVPGSENQGVCISLACCRYSNDIVASFRPKVEFSSDISISQPSLTMGQGVQGSHVLYKRLGSRGYQKLGSTYANVNDIRLPKKSTIVARENQDPLFAFGDEITCELVLQELPSLMDLQRLRSRMHPIHDVKYTHTLSTGLLSCLSEDTLQLFSANLL